MKGSQMKPSVGFTGGKGHRGRAARGHPEPSWASWAQVAEKAPAGLCALGREKGRQEPGAAGRAGGRDRGDPGGDPGRPGAHAAWLRRGSVREWRVPRLATPLRGCPGLPNAILTRVSLAGRLRPRGGGRRRKRRGPEREGNGVGEGIASVEAVSFPPTGLFPDPAAHLSPLSHSCYLHLSLAS